VRVRSAIKSPDNAISHLPVHPPLWASLPDDPLTYPHAQPLRAVPGILELNDVSRCCCFPIRSAYSPLRPSEHHSCTVYTLTGAHCTRIELQLCPSCPRTLRRFIGPETWDLGVFNFNNRILFTHDLLDEYTSAYTSSETPFVGWVATVSRRYMNHGSERPFVTEKMFRAVWFSYIQLQHLETVLQCHACGPMPQDTIWDGVTLAFSQKHLLPSLQPPTISHENSLRRNEVRYYSHMQWIPDQKLRKAIRKVIQGRSLILQSDDEDDEANDSQSRSNIMEKNQQDLLDRIEAIPGVQDDLGKFNQSLKDVFSTYFGIQALGAGIEPPAVYRRLLVQVRRESFNSILYFQLILVYSVKCRGICASDSKQTITGGSPRLCNASHRHKCISSRWYPMSL
jgi:CxC4 like cysteine cluster associated with KDZ transposases